jgi:hypothetical protein
VEVVEKEREEGENGNMVLLKGLGFGSDNERECIRVAMSL